MAWFLDSWRILLPTPWSNISLAFVAVVCGWIVGSERQKREKPAGLRTLIMVSLGAAVFTMISFAFTSTTGDSGRVAAQIVTGIGFLGAGAILRGPVGITGMTTAATIWMMAATGMVVGSGYAGAGIALSAMSLGVLRAISRWEGHIAGKRPATSVVIVFDPNGGKTTVKIEEDMVELQIPHHPDDFTPTADGLIELRLTYCHADRHYREFLLLMAAIPEVKEIRQQSVAQN